MAGAAAFGIGTIFSVIGLSLQDEMIRRQRDREMDRLRRRGDIIAGEVTEELHDLKRQEAFALGEARARGAASGTTGSTTFSRIEGDYRRAGERTARRGDILRQETYEEAYEVSRRANEMRDQLFWEAAGKIFGGGYRAGRSEGLFGGGE